MSLLLSCLLFCFIREVVCHARLTEPPARTTAWRFGFGTPANYNDHETNCGGFSRQWTKNGGKCGECGDAWDMPRPRPGERGGRWDDNDNDDDDDNDNNDRWGRGVTVRRYTPGQLLEVRVDVTANHRGHFQFGLCPDTGEETETCFRRHPVQFEDGSEKFFIRQGTGTHRLRLRLPAGLSCAQCVLQWRYVAGNNWGLCPDGSGQVGCGPQEEFRACSDISIDSRSQAGGGWPSLSTRPPRPSRPPRPPTTTQRPSTAWWAWHWPWSRRRSTGYRTKTDNSYSYLLSSLVVKNRMAYNLTNADTAANTTKSSPDVSTLTMYTELCSIVANLILDKIYTTLTTLFSSYRN